MQRPQSILEAALEAGAAAADKTPVTPAAAPAGDVDELRPPRFEKHHRDWALKRPVKTSCTRCGDSCEGTLEETNAWFREHPCEGRR